MLFEKYTSLLENQFKGRFEGVSTDPIFLFNSIFLFVASVLHVYNIEAGLGPDGESLANCVRATSGLVS